MDTFYKIWNPILFVISSLFNFLFIAVTACDLPFMISPVVRNIVLGIEEADSKKRRYKCIRAMVTPYALKACNCKRIGFQQINQNMEEEIENPRWGYWILWMAVMFFAVASFFMLVSTNILGYAASVATAASHSFFMKILNMF